MTTGTASVPVAPDAAAASRVAGPAAGPGPAAPTERTPPQRTSPERAPSERTPFEQTSPERAPSERTPFEQARLLLAAYPHAAGCPPCLDYAAHHLPATPPSDVLVATLAHHDSGHRYDLIDAAGGRFGGQF